MSTSKNVTKDNFRIVGNIEFSGDIKPIDSGLHDLGSPEKRFKDIYLADHLTGGDPRIHFGDFDFSAANVIEARDAAALANTALQPGGVDFDLDIWNKPTTLAGYGIVDSYVPGDLQASGSASLDGSAIISTTERDMIVSGSGIANFQSDVIIDNILTVTDTVYLSGSTVHKGTILPYDHNMIDIGSDASRFKDIYASDTLYIGTETFRDTDVGTIRDVQNGSYATAAQGSLADTALQPDDDIVVNNISLSGHLLGPNTMVIDPEGFGDITGKVVILGDLQVDGVTTTVNSTNVAVSGKLINLARGSSNAVEANGSGLYVEGAQATLKYMAGTDSWTTNRHMGVNHGGDTDVALSVKQSFTEASNHDIFHAIDLLDNPRVKITESFDFIINDSTRDITAIKSNGRIGINTINPAVSLHVNTTDAVMLPRGLTIQRPLAQTHSQRGYIRYNIETDRFEGFGKYNTWSVLDSTHDSDQDTYIRTEKTDGSDEDTIEFITDGTTKMWVKPTGFVGIGTEFPSTILHVNTTTPTSTRPVVIITAPTPSISLNDNSNSGDMNIQWQSSVGDESGLRFWRDDVTSPDLMISLDGNIGINTTEPETRLHIVDGTIKTEHVAVPKLNLYRNENDRSSDVGHDAIGGFWRLDNLNDVFQLRRPDDSHFVSANLNVNKFSIVKDSSRLDLGQWDGISNRIESSGRELHITSYEDGIYFGENGNKRHYFDNDGEVGINTVTPDGMLTIGNIGAVNGRKVLTFAEGATPSMWFASGLVPTDGNNYMYLDSPHANAHGIMTWKLDGNVGVNITNPVSLFHVVHRETDQSRLVTFKIEREFTPVAANTTQQRYEKAMAIDARACNIPADSVENGYRIGLDASGYIADTNFKGHLEQNYGIWARAGAYHNENEASQQGTGTINNSYAVFVDCLQSDNVTINNSYGIFQAANYTDDPDESKNYFDSRVGIGVGDPKFKLHVQHPTTNSVALFESLDANVNIRFRDNTTTSDAYVGATGNDIVLGNVSGSDHVTVKQSGKVGIGIAEPDTLLHIYADASSVNSTRLLTLENRSSDLAENSSYISFKFTDDNENEDPQVMIGAVVGQNASANSALAEGAGAFVVRTNNPSGGGDPAAGIQHNDSTNLRERFRVDYRGNVGIGTTSPDHKLDISTNDTTGLRLINHDASGVNASNDPPAILFQANGWDTDIGSRPYSARIRVNSNYSGASERGNTHPVINFDLETNEDNPDDNLSTKMMINADGNVGIGTVSPDARLHVDHSINGINSGMIVSNFNTTAGTQQHTRLQFGLARNSGTLKDNAGEIIVGKLTDWTNADTNLNSFMKFKIMDGMVSTDQLYIHTAGADFRGYVGTDEIRTKSSSVGGAVNGMKINIGESYSYEQNALGNESLFINAETGIQLNTSPDNWASGWAGRDTTFISGDQITINGDQVWHNGNVDNDDGLMRKRKRTIALAKATEKRVLRITGTSYASAIKVHMWGTTGNVVVNTVTEILVNHSHGINISSNTGAYTGVTWRVVSTGNDNFDLYVAYGSNGSTQGDALNAHFTVYTYGNESVAFEPTATAYVVNASSTNEHTHGTGTNTIYHSSRSDTSLKVDGYGFFGGAPVTNTQSNNGIYLGTSASNSDRHVSIVSPNTGNSYIDFATTGADFGGRIQYNHPGERFQIFTGGNTERLRVNSTGTTSLFRLSSRASYGWNSYGDIERVEYDVDTITMVHKTANSYTFHEYGNAETYHDFRITVDYKTGDDSHWGVSFAATGSDPENNMWSVIMRDNDNVRVQKRVSGNQSYFPTSSYEANTGITNDDGIWHTLTVEKIGDRISVWVDGSRRIAYKNFSGANDTGSVGLTTYKDSSTVVFRGFRVERLSSSTETLTGPLHIYKTTTGNEDSSILIDGATNSERSITFNDAGVVKWWFGRDNNTPISNGLGFWNGTTNKWALTFDDTTSNIAVGGISTSDAKILIGGIGANNNVKMLGFGENDTGTSSIWFNSGFEPTNQENYLSLASSYGDKLMMWKLDGRVGINGANPTRTLEVNGSIRAYGENVNGGVTEMTLDGQFGNKLFYNRNFTVPHTGSSNTFTKYFNFCIQSSGAYYYKVTMMSRRYNDAGSGTGNRFYGCVVDEGYLAWESDGDYGTNHHDGQTSSLGALTVLSKSCFLADSTTATSTTPDNNNYSNCIVRYEIQFNGVIDTTNTGQGVYVNVELTTVHGNNMITSPHFFST